MEESATGVNFAIGEVTDGSAGISSEDLTLEFFTKVRSGGISKVIGNPRKSCANSPVRLCSCADDAFTGILIH